MMGMANADDDDDEPFIVHLEPTVHIEVDAESPLEAQTKAMEQLVDEVGATGLTVEEVGLEAVVADMQSRLEQILGVSGGDTEMGVPAEDTDLDVDPDEYGAQSMYDLFSGDGDAADDDADDEGDEADDDEQSWIPVSDAVETVFLDEDTLVVERYTDGSDTDMTAYADDFDEDESDGHPWTSDADQPGTYGWHFQSDEFDVDYEQYIRDESDGDETAATA